MRKLASIQKIKELNPIPDADMIEVATVLGWKVVVKKGEFKVGDLCCYFEVDSLIPRAEWNDFLADKNKPDAPVRLRTIKLRKQVSQGLCMPLSIVPSSFRPDREGEDITVTMGVEKYEPPIPPSLSGEVRGCFPSIIPKTDEDRIQTVPDLLDEILNTECYWTVKMDGTSGTFLNLDGDHQVCSRNLSLKDDGKNTYWKMYHQYNMKELFDRIGNFAIQGEVCGEGIQKNKMQIKGHELFVFNVYDISEGKFLDYANLVSFCADNGLNLVPVFKVGNFDIKTVDEIVEIGTQCKYACGALGEGYVIRPTTERYSNVLSGRMSFKIINNKYLIKNKE